MFLAKVRGMTVERIACAGFWIVLASAAATGQQRDEQAGPGPKSPAEIVVTRTYPVGGTLPSRSVETTRSGPGDREVVTETIEMPDLDGKLSPTAETTTETIRTGPNAVQTKRDEFGFGAPGQRMLLETIRSEKESLPDGTTRTVQDTLAPDVNGRLVLTSWQIQETRSISPDVKQTDTAVFRPGINQTLQESERIQQTERQISPDLLRSESTLFVRDVNGRFQPTETRTQEVRTTGPSEYVEEETTERLDLNGKSILMERNLTRRSEANGQRQIVIETFSRNISGLVRSDNRLELGQRVRRETTFAPDGGGQTVEEVEARVPGSPNEPIRVVQRTVATIRQVDAEQWETERHVFVLDENGRLVLTIKETGQATGK
jgi:hypothetical protein